jgi:hypothetical protein
MRFSIGGVRAGSGLGGASFPYGDVLCQSGGSASTTARGASSLGLGFAAGAAPDF